MLYSEDGRRLVSASTDRTVRLWDARDQHELAPPLQGHASSVWSATFSPDGRRLATAGGAGQGSPKGAVKLWDIAAYRELLTLSADGQFFLDLRFSPDGNILAATSLDGFAHFWRAPSWGEIQTAEKGSERK